MIIQADDGKFYKDPILYDEFRKWYLRFNEESIELYIKKSNKREAIKLARNLGNWIRLRNNAGQLAIEKTKESFPPDWSGKEICFKFVVEIREPISEGWIIDSTLCFTMKHLKAIMDVEFEVELENREDPKRVSRLRSGLLIFSWEYNREELSDIYSGKRKSFLFGMLGLRRVQASMRRQLGIRNSSDLPEVGVLTSCL